MPYSRIDRSSLEVLHLINSDLVRSVEEATQTSERGGGVWEQDAATNQMGSATAAEGSCSAAAAPAPPRFYFSVQLYDREKGRLVLPQTDEDAAEAGGDGGLQDRTGRETVRENPAGNSDEDSTAVGNTSAAAGSSEQRKDKKLPFVGLSDSNYDLSYAVQLQLLALAPR